MCTTVDRGWPGFPMFPRAAESAFRAAISVPPSAECPTGRTVPAEWPSELGSVYAASLRCSRLYSVGQPSRDGSIQKSGWRPLSSQSRTKMQKIKKETKLDQKTKEEGFQISDGIETIDRCA